MCFFNRLDKNVAAVIVCIYLHTVYIRFPWHGQCRSRCGIVIKSNDILFCIDHLRRGGNAPFGATCMLNGFFHMVVNYLVEKLC